jgi:hypothetical protein
VADLAVDDVAEQSPGLAVELHQLHLFERLPIQARIVHSRLAFYFDQVPQVARACKQASAYSAGRNSIVARRQL